ncbi:MAG: segregation and condensation protein A [Gammaproteobacteria bacterium]|jgi:hypothetical protein|nr:segregation and condensation protein A [Gammaproteobacteria bacterium]
MSKPENTIEPETRILRAVKFALTQVIKDTATEPGMKHPLSEETIANLRNCLVLISEREQQLAGAAKTGAGDRPYYVDEPRGNRAAGPVQVSLDQLKRPRKPD